jgi:hypothetical protein
MLEVGCRVLNLVDIFFSTLFPFHDQKPTTLEFEVSKIIAVMVLISFFILVHVGEKFEIKALTHQPFPSSFREFFPFWN